MATRSRVRVALAKSATTVATTSNSHDSSRIFVPFLSEIHLGNLDALNSLRFMKTSADESTAATAMPSSSSTIAHTSVVQPSASNAQSPQNAATTSPPQSPQMSKCVNVAFCTTETFTSSFRPAEMSKELQLEYWTLPISATLGQPSLFTSPCGGELATADAASGGASSSAKPNGAAGNKFSIKASLKTVSIARECASNLLSITFVKEKRKDKVLQKLGRKPVSKHGNFNCNVAQISLQRLAENFGPSQARVVANVSRLICSGGKNSDLELSIDGVVYKRVRFFQVAEQFVHVKQFPISVIQFASK